MATLANAHFVDCDKNGETSGDDSWTSNSVTSQTMYNVAFDNGDSSNPIVKGETIVDALTWQNDANCIAAWLFNDGAITTDSKNSNTLTSNGTPSVNTTAGEFKEGTGSLDVNGSTDWMSITDTNLHADYPLKSTDTNKKISVALWVKFDTLGLYECFYSKYEAVAGGRSIALGIETSRFWWALGHNSTSGGTQTANIETNVTVGTGKWYHFAFTYDDADKSVNTRIYDLTADTAYSQNWTSGDNIYVNTQPVTVGKVGSGYIDGRIDEVLVFNDVLTSGEIDIIREDRKSALCVGITYDDATTGNITYILDSGSAVLADDDVMYNGADNIQIDGTPVTTTDGLTQDRTTAHPTNWAHLEGQTVQVLDDGVAVTGQSIASGVLNPGGLSGTLHVGLGYTSTVKPSKLDIQGMGLILTKKITQAIVSFYNTLRGKYGLNTTALYDVSTDTALFSGIKELPFRGQYEREGDIIVQQTEPLPMTCRGLIIDAGIHEVK